MDEESGKTHQELWEQYMEVERRELEQRRSGQLGRALGRALPGESQEELQRIADEDQRKAERGLVELRSGETRSVTSILMRSPGMTGRPA